MFKQNFIENLKNSVSPYDLISKYVKLKRQSNGEYIGLSPFTNEKTPSFTVNNNKNFYHCFSSSKHGDIINFIMDNDGLNFHEAVLKICNEFSIEPEYVDTETEEKVTSIRRLKSCLLHALELFKKELKESSTAKEYLFNRDIGVDEILNFSIGYAPDSFNQITDNLISKGFSKEEIVGCGIAIQSNKDKNKIWSKFRNRIMFPVFNSIGEVIAFGGRRINESDEAKYINSPETMIFKKRECLYNIDKARSFIASNKDETVKIVEGYLDVISMHKNGIYGVVSPMGTALTVEQINTIWRFNRNPTICFDGDSAGEKACLKFINNTIDNFSPQKTVNICMLDEGLDPFDVLDKYGKNMMVKKLNDSCGIIETLWNFEKRKLTPINTPEKKATIRDRMFKYINKVQHNGLKFYFKDELYSLTSRDIKKSFEYKKGNPITSKGTLKESYLDNILIGSLFYNPEIIESFQKEINLLNIKTPELERVRKIILDCIKEEDYFSIEQCLLFKLSEDEINYFIKNKNDIFTAFSNFDISKEEALDAWRHYYNGTKSN